MAAEAAFWGSTALLQAIEGVLENLSPSSVNGQSGAGHKIIVAVFLSTSRAALPGIANLNSAQEVS